MLIILSITSGCATIVSRTGFGAKAVKDPKASWSPYPALCLEGEILHYCATDSKDTPRIPTGKMMALSAGVMLDTPFSFLFDTIFLPYDLYQYDRLRKRAMTK